MTCAPSTITIHLPPWLEEYARGWRPSGAVEARMGFVIGAAMRNVEEGTGGPFAAGVFEIESGRLAGLGVNLVTAENLSMLHAEMVAFAAAQRALGSFDLGGPGMARYELVSSAEPCAMCFGAVLWAGVRRLVCGARSEDTERIGFDEGPKRASWTSDLEQRGIEVVRDVCRESAAAVFAEYVRRGGPVYNAREGGGA